MEIALFLLIVVAAFVASSIKIVPQQNAWVVERLGRFHGALQPGLNIVIPFIDRIAYKHLLKEVPLDVQPQVCITKDNTQVQIDGVIFYQVTNPQLASYGTADFQMAIVQLAQTSLRSECGKRELDRLLEERNDINRAVISALDEASPNWGVKVLRYEIKDITPPDAVLRSMQTQITAEREKRAMVAQSEGKRQQEINLAEGAMTAAIRESEGQKQAAINNAQGQAEAILLTATATAEAIRKVAAALSEPGGMEAVNLKVAEKYVEAFGNIAKQGNTLILPGDLSNMGALVATAMSVVKQQKIES
ncbi:putative stomatin/prohibitin-family membrane protease subunit YbbK [Sulfuriferula multivorans]|uniref:Putative stomatin/prohibitin-family membrane protease subunit YbbK n=1 Tax=Sulfuriferula multivorans TaxID=1559896 RepID=A0A401JAJ4_9PROT|nr:SPFH domain-containing protein [Sulfuriferula multivorans]GBL44576.1 putative stomatin/prohibitin-family membrane protease subunit YbbK [Sulfuriferula multivorans]